MQGTTVKKIIVAIIGGVVLLVGIAMMVLPGPAFVVIPAGLAILATEFPWAKRWLHKIREKAHNAADRFRDHRQARREQRRG